MTGSSTTTSGMGESETRLRGHAKGKGSESGMGGLGLASRRGETMPKLSLKRLVSSSEEVKGLAKRGVRLGELDSQKNNPRVREQLDLQDALLVVDGSELIQDALVGLSHRAWLAVTIIVGFILFTRLLTRKSP